MTAMGNSPDSIGIRPAVRPTRFHLARPDAVREQIGPIPEVARVGQGRRRRPLRAGTDRYTTRPQVPGECPPVCLSGRQMSGARAALRRWQRRSTRPGRLLNGLFAMMPQRY
jgi:hypothetical protein